MKRFLSKIKPYSVFLLFFIAVLMFFPENLSKSAESDRNAIITTVGVDKVDDKFSVTFLSFTPTASKEFVEVYDVVSEEADSLSEALRKMELSLGKVVEFYHTENLLIGSEAQDDIVEILDYFVKEKTLAFSSVLVGTEGSAKEFLTKVHEKNENPSNVITELMIYDSKYIYFNKPTIEVFFSGYYSDMKSSFIGTLQLNEEEASQENQQGGGDSESESKTSRKIIKNTGEIRLFKDGQMVYKMTPQEVTGLNWFQKNITEGYIKTQQDGKVKVYHMDNKSINQKVTMEDNQPIYKLNLVVNIDKQELDDGKEKHIEVNKLSNEEKELIKESIKSEIKSSIDRIVEYKVDVIDLYDKFYRDERRKFKKFLDTLQNKDDFLEKVIFDIQIDLLGD